MTKKSPKSRLQKELDRYIEMARKIGMTPREVEEDFENLLRSTSLYVHRRK